MKKILSILLVFVLFVPYFAAADGSIDLSSLSFEELVALRDKINLAIWNSREWQVVTVPQGVYKVGEDIPAGHWTIKAAEGAYIAVKWGTKLDETKKDIDPWKSDFYVYEAIKSKSRSSFDEADDKTEIDLELKDGHYIIIDDGKAIFTPYAGKPSLGFK